MADVQDDRIADRMLNCKTSLDECDCDCHEGTCMHIMPCCEQCPICEKNIRSRFAEHYEKCKASQDK